MHVAEAMRTPVITVPPDTTVEDAVVTMLEHRIGCVIVADRGPMGILTRSDILELLLQADGDLTEKTVSEVMTDDLVTTTPDTTLEKALRIMEDNGIKKLPVIDGLELEGMVTMTDVARHLPDRVNEARSALSKRPGWD